MIIPVYFKFQTGIFQAKSELGIDAIDRYNRSVDKPRNLPNADRLSIIAATILLAYASTNFLDLPERTLGVQLPSLYLALEVNVRTVVGLLVVGLTATGADWILRDHPELRDKSTFQHWLLPALTAWVIGLPLYNLSVSAQRLVGVAVGGALLMLVLVAEYIAVDVDDVRYQLAVGGLTAVSFALFLVLAIALRSAGVRLLLTLPALTFAGWLVILRTLNMRLQGQWALPQSIVLTLIITQLIAALYYLPISPTTYGLALLGPAYALTSLTGNLSDGESLLNAIIGPAIVLIVVWVTALWTL